MIAIEKPKNPMKINCVWWDGFNKEEVESVFPSIGFSRHTIHDEDPYEVRICMGGNHVKYIDGGVFLCLKEGDSLNKLFTLTREEFEKQFQIQIGG